MLVGVILVIAILGVILVIAILGVIFFNPTGQRVPLIVILGVIFLTPLASVYHRSRF